MTLIASLLPASQEVYRKIVFEIDDGVIGIDADGIIRLCNPSAERIFGWRSGELLEKPLEVLLPEHLRTRHQALVSNFRVGADDARYMGSRTAEIVGRRADGSDVHLGITILKTSATSEPIMIAVIRDISERISYQRELQRLAQTDPLTGLLNRRAFHDSVAGCLQERQPASSAIVLFDLDDFKGINDRYGHDAGDDVLVRFADILRGCVRGNDLAGRWGGEEFILFLPGVGSDAAVVVTDRIRALLTAADFHWKAGGTPGLTASAGVFAGGITIGSLGTAIARADKVLYEAKRSGRDRFVVAPDTEVADLVR
ncbi:sensor domain-containing diguanylate cyclase [Pseudorhizobium endolithicum]|uniref:diguanylate cyclase n=1 Tax=Pseudorhizobium endolithicum TaxID=1191678 RepID=A0ABN7JDM4_9HYPH|nr:sensor domain-containing diguanylate cyclase [Pseudorhizobium endolithicum]CAD6409687.1 sensor domain-containing diguanylate cyclase [Rhizobium sp. Q54]CAD7024855.1 sensor domain-containing diguanylate cyclase [Pseudorhizobium endolithicum]